MPESVAAPEPGAPAGARGRLAGKRVLVVGAGSGIGQVIATAFAREHAVVVAGDLDGPAAVATARATGGGAIQMDVTDPGSAAAAVGYAGGSMGGIDVLVNCAGINRRTPFLEISARDFSHVLDVNLTGAFIISQAAARRMAADRVPGRIINMASISEHRPYRGMAAYLASKAGVAALTRGMALELAGSGIRVNAIAAGLIETPMTAGSLSDPATRAERVGKIAVGRVGQPEDLLGAALLLASDESAWMTGVVLVVDGGQLLT